MSELTKFQCDVTGEVYGALNAGDGLYEVEIRKRISEFEIESRTIHISNNEISEKVGYLYPDLKYIGVQSKEIIGAAPKNDVYQERGNFVIDHYEPFFKFIEEEILY